MSGSCGGQGGVPALQPGTSNQGLGSTQLRPLSNPLGLSGDTPSASHPALEPRNPGQEALPILSGFLCKEPCRSKVRVVPLGVTGDFRFSLKGEVDI